MDDKKYTLRINMKNGGRFVFITNMNTIGKLKMCFDIKEKLNEDFVYEVEGIPIKIHEVDNAIWFPFDEIYEVNMDDKYKLLIKMKNEDVLEFITDITSINRLKLRYGIRNKNSVIEIAGQLIKISEIENYKYAKVDFTAGLF